MIRASSVHRGGLFALAAVPACGDRAPRASEASASAALNASGDHFLLASFYRMTYTFEALGADGVLAGEGAYLPEATVYARASVKVDDIVEQEALYRPPDLYLYGAEDGWTVISPWNQGMAADEDVGLPLAEPTLGYRDSCETCSRCVSKQTTI